MKYAEQQFLRAEEYHAVTEQFVALYGEGMIQKDVVVNASYLSYALCKNARKWFEISGVAHALYNVDYIIERCKCFESYYNYVSECLGSTTEECSSKLIYAKIICSEDRTNF